MARPRTLATMGAVGSVLAAVLAGAVTATAGTVAHLWAPVLMGAPRPVGLAVAIGLVVATDIAWAAGTRRASVMMAVTAGRVLVIATLLGTGPGGDVAFPAGWRSETWLLVASVFPAVTAPVLSLRAAAARVRAERGSPLGQVGTSVPGTARDS